MVRTDLGQELHCPAGIGVVIHAGAEGRARGSAGKADARDAERGPVGATSLPGPRAEAAVRGGGLTQQAAKWREEAPQQR